MDADVDARVGARGSQDDHAPSRPRHSFWIPSLAASTTPVACGYLLGTTVEETIMAYVREKKVPGKDGKTYGY